MYVPDNTDVYNIYEREHERDQYYSDRFSSIEKIADDIEIQCIDYDTEDNADLCNRLQEIIESIDKLRFYL